MDLIIDIEGLNLEKLLRAASDAGIVLRDVRRVDARTMRVRVHIRQMRALCALCDRFGWEMSEHRSGALIRLGRFLKRRSMLLAAALLCVFLVYAASQAVLRIEIDHAGENVAVVREEIASFGVHILKPKALVSTDALRAHLEFALPGLTFAGARFEGSTLIVDCRAASLGEQLEIDGQGNDIVASEAGIVTKIWVQSGTPQVEPGQAVYAGQVLISGEERTQKGESVAVRAQGQVTARVFARGDARVSLSKTTTVETGQTRRRVTLVTPWHECVVRDAQPFESQDASTENQKLVGLFLPVYRRIETFAETAVFSSPRSEADARSMAQGAAENIAKNKCPVGIEPLDKWVEYSMIDNEFVYATVVIEYEKDIAARKTGTNP